MKKRTFEVEPLTPALGAIVHGLDLRDALDAAPFEALRDALHAHGVVFLRDQPLDDAQHLALARRFGTPTLYPVLEILGGRPPETIEDGPDSPPKADYWHTDVTWLPAPPDYGMLCMQHAPATGGDTLWASTAAAYDALSPVMRGILERLTAHHGVGPEFFDRVEAALGREKADRVRRELRGGAEHPLVVRHPQTGRRAVYFGGSFLQSISGLHPEESRDLIDLLWRHVVRTEWTVRWRWRDYDIALWDERTTLHRALADHFPARRVVRRLTVAAASPPSVWGALD